MSWAAAVFFIVAAIVSALTLKNIETATEVNEVGEVAAISGSMLTYRSYVVTYATANPAITGVVDDAVLGLPSWYSKLVGVSNYVSGGKGYVYYTNPPPKLPTRLLSDANNSIYVGIKQAGVVTNPISGTGTVTAPAAIPDGAVVYAGG